VMVVVEVGICALSCEMWGAIDFWCCVVSDDVARRVNLVAGG
jgi:hypothetical protein